jgi:hypothetical protein
MINENHTPDIGCITVKIMVFVAQTNEISNHMSLSHVIRAFTAASDPRDSKFPCGTNLLLSSGSVVLGPYALFRTTGCGSSSQRVVFRASYYGVLCTSLL